MSSEASPNSTHFNTSYLSLSFVLLLEWKTVLSLCRCQRPSSSFAFIIVYCGLSAALHLFMQKLLMWQKSAWFRISLDSYDHFTFQWHKAGMKMVSSTFLSAWVMTSITKIVKRCMTTISHGPIALACEWLLKCDIKALRCVPILVQPRYVKTSVTFHFLT